MDISHVHRLAGLFVLFLVACDSGGGSGDGPEPPPNGGGLDPPPVIVTDALPSVVAGRPFVAQVDSTTHYPPVAWQLVAPPPWVRIAAATGRFWGETPSAGTNDIRFRVTDAEGQATDKVLALVAEAPAPAVAPIVLGASADAIDGAFRTAARCAVCHANSAVADAMRDASGEEVAPHDLWEPSAMAMAFRDPWYRAVVAVERTVHPDLGDELESTCLRCHAPMAQEASGGTLVLADALANSGRGAVARDGVSCTLCHQIDAQGLGDPQTWSGAFGIEPGRPANGPHDGLFAMPMVGSSGYLPEAAAHATDSGLCATCHVLFTQTHDLEGNPLPQDFPEQTPYLEWLNSDFGGEPSGPRAASCAECHFPRTGTDGQTIETGIARRPDGTDFPPLAPRTPYGRHTGIGANALLSDMLATRSAELAPDVAEDALLLAAAETRTFLGSATAEIAIGDVDLATTGLTFTVEVRVHTGHKFPTSYPSRRAWLHVTVTDADGVVRFESGAHDSRGRIVDSGGVPLPFEAIDGPIEPHRETITSAEQVALYEPVLADVNGDPTFLLLHASHYLKDNRLLPEGWSDTHPEIDAIAPVGTDADADFTAGGDRVVYSVVLPADTPGPIRIDAALLYQPISARFIHEILRWEALAPVNDFREMYESAPRSPETVASDTAQAP